MAKKVRIETPVHKRGVDVLDLKVQEAKKKSRIENRVQAFAQAKYNKPVKVGQVWTSGNLSSEFEKRKRIKKAW